MANELILMHIKEIYLEIITGFAMTNKLLNTTKLKAQTYEEKYIFDFNIKFNFSHSNIKFEGGK